MLAVICAFGGPLVNKIGVKWSLIIGAATFPIRGASYYTNSKYGNQWVSLVVFRGDLMTMSPSSNGHGVLVPDLWQLPQRHWYGLLVCCRGRFHPVSSTFRSSWEIPGPMDRVS